jgi:hypothetical protein
MNLFWAAVRNVTPVLRFESLHRFKTLSRPTKSVGSCCEREVDFRAMRLESFSLREIGHDVHLRTFATPTALRPARFKERGGRANRRRCARWRRSPSDCQVKPHSNMRHGVLCRNFSKRDFRVPFALNKRDTHEPTENRREGEASERVETDGLRERRGD